MAFVKSGLYIHTFVSALTGVALTGTGGFNMTLTTWKLSLVLGTATDGSAPVNFSIGDSHWVNTSEATGTGWVTGGIAVSALGTGSTSGSPTFAEGTTGSLRYDQTTDTSVANTSLLSAVGGAILYAANLTAPADMTNAMVCCINFGGSTYTTNSGTFAIQWSATGIFELDITP